MNKKEQKMREEAKAAIIEALEDGYGGYYCDLHNEVFNTDYYIIGTYQAKEALKEYDIWEAIEKVQMYEKENFGEIYTDLSDPEKLINMLYYIIGEEVLFDIMDGVEAWEENWNNIATDEINAEILKALKVPGQKGERKMKVGKLTRAVADVISDQLLMGGFSFADAEKINKEGWTIETAGAMGSTLRYEGVQLTKENLKKAWELAQAWTK